MIPSFAIKIATKQFEKRFSKVHRLPGTDGETVTLGGLKNFPAPQSVPEVEFTTKTFHFLRITSGEQPDGRPIMFPTDADAAHAWMVNANRYLDAHPDVSELYWRVEPQVDFQKDFEREESGYAAYSRLAIH